MHGCYGCNIMCIIMCGFMSRCGVCTVCVPLTICGVHYKSKNKMEKFKIGNECDLDISYIFFRLYYIIQFMVLQHRNIFTGSVYVWNLPKSWHILKSVFESHIQFILLA